MSPLMIERIAIVQLAEHRERAARLRQVRQVRGESRRARRSSDPSVASQDRAIRSRLRLPAHPA